MKYKIGDILKVKEDCKCVCSIFIKIDDAKYIRIHNIGLTTYGYEVLNSKKEVTDGYCACFNDSHLEPLTKSWDNLEVGDELVDEYGSITTVFEVLSHLVAVSYRNMPNSFNCWFSKKGLQESGYTIKQPTQVEEVQEMTMEDVCKALGKTVKIKK